MFKGISGFLSDLGFIEPEQPQRSSVIAYLDSSSEEDRRYTMILLSQNTTVNDLKNEIKKRFHIETPRIFFHRNRKELSDDIDLKSFVDLVVIVTKDGNSLTFDRVGETVDVPNGPPPKPFVGNAMDFLPNIGVAAPRLRATYGNIFKIILPLLNKTAVFLADPVLSDEIFKNPEVWQKLHMKHVEFRNTIGDGLFTSDDDEEIWHMAHRILIPAFSHQGMKQYFKLVLETADDLTEKLKEFSESKAIVDVNDWCARFTFEVIGRVSFGMSFNSFTSMERPSFLRDLEESLEERTLSMFTKMVPRHPVKQKSALARQKMNVFLKDLIAKKRQELETHPETRNKKDISTLMLLAKDPETGKSLPENNIVSQSLTFLVAGHDSTSTALTSLLFNLSANPDVEAKVIKEIAEVIGDQPLTWEHLSKLPYCTMVIKENLRMLPPAGAVIKTAVKDMQLGKYFIPANTQVLISTWAIHYNPEVWPNPDVFDPERHTPDKIKSRPMSAWLPFSYGPRACIGQQLSLLEQHAFLALIYAKFNFRLHHTAKITLTFPLFAKPNGVIMTVTKRTALTAPTSGQAAPAPIVEHHAQLAELTVNTTGALENPLLILYGSNMETCIEFSRQIEERAKNYGFPVLRRSLDEFISEKFQGLPTEDKGAVIIVTSTYNGEPPDNARNFRKWISENPEEASKVWRGVKYSVFGAGNSQWRTYQVFPVFLDQNLERIGAVRFCETGRGDCNDGTIDDSFAEWQAQMWLQLHTELRLNTTAKPDEGMTTFTPIVYKVVEDQKPDMRDIRAIINDFAKLNNAFLAKVLNNRELVYPGLDGKRERSTRHVEFEIAEGVTYTAGDHLAVYPVNHPLVVQYAAKILELDINTVIIVEKDRKGNDFPYPVPVTIGMALSRGAELQAVATRAQIAYLASKTQCPPERDALKRLSSFEESSASNSYENYIQKSRRTVLELLEQYKSVKLTFGEFLGILTPIKARYYSIASSYKFHPKKTHITVGVVEGISQTGRVHKGSASTYLAGLNPGDHALVLVKKSNFRLPQDLSCPVIMIGPGTGVAPMIGFIQERIATKATGENVLFYGCRNEQDHIYREELEAFKKDGTLSLLEVAYSRAQAQKVYVQHKIVENGAYLYKLLQKGAYIYICGDAKVMAPDVRQAFVTIIQQEGGMNSVQSEEFVASLRHTQRYNEDVWASSI